VRGPLTHARLRELGYSCPSIFGDPAILIPNFLSPCSDQMYDYGVVPHYTDFENVRESLKNSSRINVIDVSKSIENVVEEITKCRSIVSSSLHGIILSHSYNIPAKWVKFGNKVFGDGVKFRDYFGSVGLECDRPIDLSRNLSESDVIDVCAGSKSGSLPRIELGLLGEKLLNVCPFS